MIKIIKIFGSLFLFILLFKPNLYAQIIDFFPKTDVLYAESGCTEPLISIFLSNSNSSLTDTISIIGGFNTYLMIDFEDKHEDIEKFDIIIMDSSNSYQYELWLGSDTVSFRENIPLPMDSVFSEVGYQCKFKLYVKYDKVVTDSLIQTIVSLMSGSVTYYEDAKGDFSLSQNFPNPFNNHTNIQYNLIDASIVKLEIFNSKGQFIESIVNENQMPGIKHVTWGGNVASGIYFYRIEVSSINNKLRHYNQIKKMILLK